MAERRFAWLYILALCRHFCPALLIHGKPLEETERRGRKNKIQAPNPPFSPHGEHYLFHGAASEPWQVSCEESGPAVRAGHGLCFFADPVGGALGYRATLYV
ncbi:hypothetical protein IF2G_00953 [Cordyceps javanica]|nr:hypothetical protein IF2G_00953 [Cordyceps javanica]